MSNRVQLNEIAGNLRIIDKDTSLPLDKGRFDVPQLVEGIVCATNAAGLTEAIEKAFSEIDVDRFCFGLIPRQGTTQQANDRQVPVLGNVPMAWLQRYKDNRYLADDPRIVATYLLRRPLYWDRDFSGTPRENAFFEDARSFGFCSGLALPLEMSEGRGAILISSSSNIPKRDMLGTLWSAKATMIASFAQTAFERIVLRQDASANDPVNPAVISEREVQVLALHSSGLTAAQIARTLCISENTVNTHFKNLKKKLQVENLASAAVMANRLGLI